MATAATGNTSNTNGMIVMMRHSERQDSRPKPDINWSKKQNYGRPYDPPISNYKLPLEKAKEITTLLPNFKPTKIISSPYLRCIQTSAVIGSYFDIKSFVIDARLGEDKKSINRCINCAIKEIQELNEKKQNYDNIHVPCNNYQDVTYLNIDEITMEIKKIYSSKYNNQNVNFNIIWNHKEPAGNDKYKECVQEYRKTLSENILMITHADVMKGIYKENINSPKPMSPSDCGWYTITKTNVFEIYSPTAIWIVD